jgi:RNA-binding protein
MKKEMMARVHALSPAVHIGKSGLSQGIVDEVKLKLKKEKVIKVRFLSSAVSSGNKKALFKELAERAGATIVHAVGFVVTLSRGVRSSELKQKTI